MRAVALACTGAFAFLALIQVGAAGEPDFTGVWTTYVDPSAPRMPVSMLRSVGYPMEIHQRPEQIIIIYEEQSEIRRVYLGNRIVPDADRIPGRNGHSSGRWEGDTLVVETTHLVEQLDYGFGHSADAKIVERYRLTTDPNGTKVLAVEMTMSDPAFYTQPVKREKKWAQVPNGYVLPYECAEEGWRKRLEELQKKAKPGA